MSITNFSGPQIKLADDLSLDSLPPLTAFPSSVMSRVLAVLASLLPDQLGSLGFDVEQANQG